jgi:mono/diheme cytochrome c family protein
LTSTLLALAAVDAAAQTPVGDASADRIVRGEYLAIAGDCTACHTAPGGKPFAGGLAIPTPVGDIVATNITPSKSAGIGHYTLQQFSDAMRRGIRADGARLYPAMPYTAYAKVTDDDIAALYAYFMQRVGPVDVAPPPTRLPFPFDIRLSMAAWNALFLDPHVFAADPAKSAEWNRGAYLAEGLAHCGSCHTPRNWLMAESSSRPLAGGKVGPWDAPNITSDVDSGIGGWSERDLVSYMHDGAAPGKGQAAGPMAEAIDASLQHMTEADLRAIAVYMKSVPAVHDTADTRPRYAWGAAASDVDSIRGVAWPQDRDRMTGPQLYDAWCATCHQFDGQGSFDGKLPPLFHNTSLGRPDSANLVLVMLGGIRRQGEIDELPMPGFAQLSDRQLATLGTWLVQRYGNPAAKVTDAQVARLRRGGGPSYLAPIAQAAIGIGAVVVVMVIALLVRRRRRP